MLLNDAPRVDKIPILNDRSDKRRSAESVVWYLVSVAFVAVSTIVLFSVASVSILGISKEMLTGPRIDNRSVEDKSIGTVFFYTDSSTVPVSVQAKSPSSSEANSPLSSTPAPQPSGMQREETEAKPSPNPQSDSGLSAAAVEIPHGSTQGPSTDVHNFEIQRNDHGNLDQGSAAFAPEESRVKENTGSYDSTVSPGSPPLRHAASHRASAVEADHNITGKLNRAELSRLLKGSRASLR